MTFDLRISEGTAAMTDTQLLWLIVALIALLVTIAMVGGKFM